jgi:hypothetical protein
LSDAPRLRNDTIAVVLDPLYSKSELVHPAHYWATSAFLSSGTDEPANQYFDRLASTFELAREVSCPFWERQQDNDSFGAVRLLNNDGGLDGLADEQIRDRGVRAFIGRKGQHFADFVQVAKGAADTVDNPDEQFAVLTVLSRGAELEIALQENLFAAVANTTLRVRPRPLAIGRPLSCPVPLVTPSSLYHEVHESAPYAISLVRDRGASVAFTPSSNGFTLSAQPSGMIVADVEGTEADVGFAPIESLTNVLRYLLITRGPLAESDVDFDSIAALEIAAPYAISLYIDQPCTLASVLSEILDSFGGWWFFDRLGKFRVGRLEAPEGTPDLVIPAWQLDHKSIRRTFDRAPGLSSACLGQRNFYVYDQSSLAGSLLSPTVQQIGLDLQQQYRVRKVGTGSLAREYTHANNTSGSSILSDGADVARGGTGGMPTLFGGDSEIQDEATRRVALYSQRRWKWDITVRMAVDDALILEPGQLIHVTANRYGLAGGKLLRVIGVRLRPRDSSVLIKTWG